METIFKAILSAGLHGSVVILAVMVLRLLLRKTQKKFLCLLWVLAFVRLLLPFEIQSSLSLQPQMEPLPQSVHQSAELPVRPEYVPLERPEIQAEEHPASREPAEAPEAPEAQTALPGEPQKAPASVLTLLSWIWLAVFLGFGAWSVATYVNLRLRVREAVKIKGGWECDRIETAFILGFIRPRIYIPMGMSPEIRRYILAHERTHLEKGDHWLKMFGFLALSIHWYNPLVWIAYVMLCKDIELACDERVVRFMDLRERKAYSSALLTCSTNRVHLAACPVAFGEVSVKERIKRVLNYKKPGFWISLLGVLAIVFVAVCLVTSPTEKTEEKNTEEVIAETRPGSRTPVGEGFAATLSLDQIPFAGKDAIEELGSRESYCVKFTQKTLFDGEETVRQGHRRKYGENSSFMLENVDPDYVSYLEYDGQLAGSNGGYFVWVGQTAGGPDTWLDIYAPSYLDIEYGENDGFLDGNTVAFQARCQSEDLPVPYDAHFTFTFREDGTLDALAVTFSYDADEGGKVVREFAMEVLDEAPEETRRILDEAAASVLSPEEADRMEREKDIVVEIPSNRSGYDRHYEVGASRMSWELLDGRWFLKFGADNVSPTSLELFCENSEVNDGSNLTGTIQTAGVCSLEVLKDGKWEFYGNNPEISLESREFGVGDRIAINWADTIGTLPGGYYRVGMEYTFHGSEGETDVKYCYAKFRIYGQEEQANLAACRQGVQNLLNTDSYHIIHTEWNRTGFAFSDKDLMVEEQIWKNGEDFLSQSTGRNRHNNELLWISGSRVKDGVGYSITYNNNDFNDIASQEVVAHIDRELMEFWSVIMEIYDSEIQEVVRQDDEIRVLLDYGYNDDYLNIEMNYSFDREGRLTGIQQIYVRQDGTRLVEEQLEADYDDPQTARDMTAQREEGTIGSFCYEEEARQYDREDQGIRRKNFLNTEPVVMATPAEVIDRAFRDCTLPSAAGYEPGTNIYEVFYDEETQMWKVAFTASWDDTIYQAVYMDRQGITQFTVTLELDPVNFD